MWSWHLCIESPHKKWNCVKTAFHTRASGVAGNCPSGRRYKLHNWCAAAPLCWAETDFREITAMFWNSWIGFIEPWGIEYLASIEYLTSNIKSLNIVSLAGTDLFENLEMSYLSLQNMQQCILEDDWFNIYAKFLQHYMTDQFKYWLACGCATCLWTGLTRLTTE